MRSIANRFAIIGLLLAALLLSAQGAAARGWNLCLTKEDNGRMFCIPFDPDHPIPGGAN
jgi:hypothetical protein